MGEGTVVLANVVREGNDTGVITRRTRKFVRSLRSDEVDRTCSWCDALALVVAEVDWRGDGRVNRNFLCRTHLLRRWRREFEYRVRRRRRHYHRHLTAAEKVEIARALPPRHLLTGGS